MKITIRLFLFCLFSSLIFSNCLRLRISDKKAEKLINPYNSLIVNRYRVNGHTMRYLEIGNDSLPTVVMLHGGLGTASTYKVYMTDTILARHFRLVIPDRYGHGYSDFGKTETDMEKQAAYLLPMMRRLKQSGAPLILMGHSFGGTVAARFSMDYPDIADQLILTSPALDPSVAKLFKWNKPFDFFLIKWLMPRNVIIANDEKLTNKAEITKMLPLYGQIKTPTIYVHGKDDWIVNFGNAAFLKEKLSHVPTESILRDSLDHAFIFKKPEILRGILLQLIDQPLPPQDSSLEKIQMRLRTKK